jgi:coenzyme F420-reducing hydrogenase beta subunit
MPEAWKHGRVFLAAARAHGVVDGVVHVAERGHAVDDAGQRIGALNARAEADGLEEGLRGGAEGGNRRLAQRIGKADALEGVALERIADREVQAGGGLVVVLRQRLLRRGQVDRLPVVAW